MKSNSKLTFGRNVDVVGEDHLAGRHLIHRALRPARARMPVVESPLPRSYLPGTPICLP